MKKQLLWKRSLVLILALLLVFPNLNMVRAQASGGNLTVESAVAGNLDGNLNSVIYANGKYTAVGEGGKVIQSADGMNWTLITVPFSNAKISWRSIAFTSSTYVVTGVDYTNSTTKAKLMVSTDGGATWTDKSTAVTADVLQSVRYLNGAFYAVGGRWSTSNSAFVRAEDLGVVYSSADGQNWSQWSTTACFWPSGSTTSTPFYLTDISYFNGKYVVTGNVFAGYAYSTNGASWTTKFLSGLSNSYGLDSLSVYNSKLYVSHSWNEGFASSDGMTFTADSSYNRTLGVVQVGSQLYRFGRAGEMYSSVNGGAAWTAANSVTNHTIRSAASNGTGMVLITTSSPSLVVTPDRVTWKRLSGNLQGIAYNGSAWGVAGSISPNDSAELPDGFILSSSGGWDQLSTADTLLPAQGLSKIAYGNNLFVAAGKRVGVSADAQTWTISDLPAGAAGPVTGLAYGASGFVAVTKGDKILTSADGTSWTVGATYSGATFYNVKYVNGVYVAFGTGGVWSSVNGTSWSSLDSLVNDYQQSSEYYSIYDVTYANGKYMVVVTNGNDGFPHVLETTGALSGASVWTDHVIDGSSNWTELYSIDYGNGMYVAVGSVYDVQGNQHHVAYSSNDLQTWTKYDEQALGVSGSGLSQVLYQNNKFYIVGNGNTKIVLGSGGIAETTPAAVIDYTAEQLTGLTANGSYTVNGNVVTADASGKLAMDSSWLGTPLSIVKKGNGTTTTDSTAQTLNVPSRPAAPSSVGKTNETAVNANDGSLTNVTTAMEYKKGSVGAWSDVTGTSVTGLAPDMYYVRTKATSSAFASAPVQVTVGAFTATPETTPAAVIDYTAEQLTGLTASGSYTVNGNAVTADASGKLAMDSSWLGTPLSIVKKGNGSTTTDSTAQTLNVPSRPAAPSSVGKTNETAVNANDGSLTNVSTAMEYKKGSAGAWSDVTGTSVPGLAPDMYYVRTKATSSAFASAPVQVTVDMFTATPETTPAAVIDYTAEQLTGLTANGSYTVNGNAVTADASGKLAIDSSWLGTPLSIVKKGNGTTTTDSTAQTLNVPSRPAAPSSVGKTNETAVNTNDGSLTNVSTEMEYKKGSVGAWSDVTGTSVTGLAPDMYYVRTKATSSAFASAPVQVTVGAFTATPETTPAAVIDYTAEQLTGLTANGSYTVNGNVVTADASGKLAIDSSWLGTPLSIVKKGNGSTTTDSTAQTLNVPSRSAAPSSVGKTNETAVNANDGSLTNVSTAMEYKKGSAGTWSDVTGTSVTELSPDMYYVRTKSTPTTFASAPVQVTVGAFMATPETTPAAVIDYTAEQLTGLTANGSYTVNGNAVTADANGKLAIDSSWLGTPLSIVKKGNGSTTTDSTAQTLNVPSRSAAPVGVTVTDITYGGANNGSIQNVTLQMEYKKGSAGSWTTVEDTAITGLAPDTYYIRVKATPASFASIALQVTVHNSNAVIPAAPEVTADDQNNTIVGLDTSMEFAVDDKSYVRYDGTNLPDLSGNHIVKVRVAASGSLPAPSTTLTFTDSVPAPAGGLNLSASDPSGTGNNGKTQITVTPAPAAGHNLYYKNFGTGSAVVPNVGDILAGYTLVGSDGLVPAANGERMGIAEVDAGGKVVKYGSVIAVVVAETAAPSTDPGNTNSNTGGTPSGTGGITEVIVLVNGKQENAGTATTTTTGTVKTTTIAVDPSKLQAKLDTEGKGAVVTIPVSQDSNIFVGELNGQMIKNMENVSSTLVLQTNNASYILPAKEINIGAMAQQFGTGVKLEDIKLKITIGETSTTMSQVITGAASRDGFTLIAPSLDFTITGTYGNSTVEISRFNAYVERTVALPAGIDPKRITTGIVVDPDGTVRHVPTKIILKDGKYYAEINSLTNSSYSVVWHPMTFADVENHWAKDAVNDMGSRMIVNGVNETTFNPNSDITRAEFAAIIVRGLGLKLGEGKTAFADVPADAWYAGAVETASEFGLITGFEDGTFRPDAKITREQAMNIIAKAMKPTGLADRTGAADAASVLASFIDAGSVGDWAKDSLALAVKAGLISGRSGNKLEAKSNVTRAEVAVLIQRLLQKSDLTN
ncbi:hypothetical protein A3842_20850 [Paenibacillus sp. P3E]|uniref:S-layer homology domain-containing protein n=1 Tax=Paenibacillus sp. P3E TaxID=1349435 RepID=UPI00093ECD97|nr:S-layer homology domain-containing protein [Paenibacillus sp. P3E]OKP74448.1 hypothetical protein A3842_20850 [Paenibacillus sp. P3E]